MATIHITQEEAARDLTGLIARVHGGDSFVIENGSEPVAVLQPAPPRQLTFEERLEKLKGLRMGADFADDVEDGIALHREPLDSSAWD